MRVIPLLSTFLISLIFSAYSLTCYATDLTLFSTQTEAQQHCPNDEVEWLNLPTKILHAQGTHRYNNTKNGAYVYKQEALMFGCRRALNE